VVEADRGGSVTYHGPGQLVVYPIVRTPEGSDVVAFVRALEGAVIAALAAFSIRGERVGGRSGVWCGGNKICAIGVKFSRDTTLHGLALNVATDLEKFTRIVPCGISDAGVASMESLGRAATLDEAAEALLPELSSALGAFQLRTEGR
jgi:lipoyl(octanoyl) transferase